VRIICADDFSAEKEKTNNRRKQNVYLIDFKKGFVNVAALVWQREASVFFVGDF
jgi:hypothetical protein